MPAITFLSLGAGAQSSALLIMSALGLRDCPRAAFAVFADTGDEPAYVYRQLAKLAAWGEAHGVPVHIAKPRRTLSHDSLHAKRVLIPAFTLGDDGRSAPIQRSCTSDYKLRPIAQIVRRIGLGLQPRQRLPPGTDVIALLGISVEESHRMRDRSFVSPWIANRYPLVDARMTRSACVALLQAHGFDHVGKSACIYCPFHSDRYWRALRDEHPDDFARALAFDDAIRHRSKESARPIYLHRSLVPLREVPLDTDQPDLFGNECEGACGL